MFCQREELEGPCWQREETMLYQREELEGPCCTSVRGWRGHAVPARGAGGTMLAA